MKRLVIGGAGIGSSFIGDRPTQCDGSALYFAKAPTLAVEKISPVLKAISRCIFTQAHLLHFLNGHYASNVRKVKSERDWKLAATFKTGMDKAAQQNINNFEAAKRRQSGACQSRRLIIMTRR